MCSNVCSRMVQALLFPLQNIFIFRFFVLDILTNFILFICWRRNKYNLFCKTVLIWLFCHVSFKRKRNVTLAFYFGFVVLTLILHNNATIFIFKCGSLRWSSLTDVHPCFWQKTRQTLFHSSISFFLLFTPLRSLPSPTTNSVQGVIIALVNIS